MNPIIVDVREKDEFEAEHAENSIHIPLSEFDKRAPALFKTLSGKSVILMCQSGKRAQLAALQATKFCDNMSLKVYSGGISAWKQEGNPTTVIRKNHLPVMRQVQLIAGILVLMSSLFAYFFSPNFVFLAGFVGLGLTFAGATGYCGMAELLAKMPWNRSYQNIQKELCEVSSSSSACSTS